MLLRLASNGPTPQKATLRIFTQMTSRPNGPNGSVQDEYNGSAWTAQYVYAGSELIAEYKNNTTEFVHTDHLGSTRLVTAVNKSVLDSLDYLPFGQQIAGDTSTTHKFTGKERDTESGLDNFGARYDASSLGRFMTPDPMGGHLEDPQTLNRYAYVRNNPTNLTDPTGLDFNLVCTQNKDNGSTCQGGHVGTTDDKGNFTATVVTSASLQDSKSGNTGTVNENGVQITTAQGTFQGDFIDKTPAADLSGSGLLQDFSFKIDGNCGGSCFSSGQYTYNGTNDQARDLLDHQGAWKYTGDKDQIGLFGHSWDEVIFKDHRNTTQHRFGKEGADSPSPHFSVPRDPSATVPSRGGFHVDNMEACKGRSLQSGWL